MIMSAVQCTNPAAVNYNPQATSDDGSCLYLDKIGGVCYAFQDLPTGLIEDQSWTLSWSVEMDNWVFFHDYVPDFYVLTRDKLFALGGGRIYGLNSGLPGVYIDGTTKSFFMDVIFNGNEEMTLNTLRWVTTVLNNDGSESPFETLTHVTIWNGLQCTGRITLAQVFQDLQYANMRKTRSEWSFDNFRDQVITQGTQFLQDIFGNFAVDPSKLSTTMPWFEQLLLEDMYFVVRFEFDNTSGKKIYIEETNADVSRSYR